MKRLLILLLSLLSICAKAQSNFQPGYIIKAQTDTLKGYIDYKEWNQNPKSIAFRSNTSESSVTQYTVNQIKGFDVNGKETYFTYTVNVSAGSTRGSELSVGPNTSYDEKQYF